jgi:hypothetical protein
VLECFLHSKLGLNAPHLLLFHPSLISAESLLLSLLAAAMCQQARWVCRTPCVGRIYDALPAESRTGRVRMLVPDAQGSPVRGARGVGSHHPLHAIPPAAEYHPSAAKPEQSCVQPHPRAHARLLGQRGTSQAAKDTNGGVVIHLAATGDQGFSRRLRLSFPMLRQACVRSAAVSVSVALALRWMPGVCPCRCTLLESCDPAAHA